jgi:RNA polymerase sigma-70 factor (ECF subfamily)
MIALQTAPPSSFRHAEYPADMLLFRTCLPRLSDLTVHVYEQPGPNKLEWVWAYVHHGAVRTRRCQQAGRMGFTEIIALMGILAGAFPEDDPASVSLDIPHLVQRAQAGDREAVSILYRAYVRRIHRYFSTRLPTASDAEDATADVFVRMVEGLPAYKTTGAPFEAWLYRIAASRVSDFYRSKSNRLNEALQDNLDDDTPASEEVFIEGQTVESLRAAMNQLPEEHQMVLILRFVERNSHEEVAALLGKSSTAVKTIQHRALLRLSELMGSPQKARHYLRGDHE